MVCGSLDDKQLKIEIIGQWIDSEWLPTHPDHFKLLVGSTSVTGFVLEKFDPLLELTGGYHFTGTTPMECPVVISVNNHDYNGELTHHTGAFLYHFTQPETDTQQDVLVVASHHSDQDSFQGWYLVVMAAMPEAFLPTWMEFFKECERLESAHDPKEKVLVIGGRKDSFVPKTDWEEVVLPARLKSDILEDVQSFFQRGVDIYKRLNLKPFRKLLLAGVPGTGKTMLCSALSKWALDQGYLVVYISSALRRQGDETGARFDKIEYALSVAAHSRHPTLVLLEELDAYLHDEEKALILNVLDGAESEINEKGTLLIATTNYPEAIDERILKRPGRLDRIFIIPEMRERQDAEKLLKRYLGALWREEHSAIVPKLIGYPGAFVREVAIYALTQVAYADGTELPLELLEESFRSLKDQIEARDDFLKKRNGMGFGQAVPTTNGGGHN